MSFVKFDQGIDEIIMVSDLTNERMGQQDSSKT